MNLFWFFHEKNANFPLWEVEFQLKPFHYRNAKIIEIFEAKNPNIYNDPISSYGCFQFFHLWHIFITWYYWPCIVVPNFRIFLSYFAADLIKNWTRYNQTKIYYMYIMLLICYLQLKAKRYKYEKIRTWCQLYYLH